MIQRSYTLEIPLKNGESQYYELLAIDNKILLPKDHKFFKSLHNCSKLWLEQNITITEREYQGFLQERVENARKLLDFDANPKSICNYHVIKKQ